MSYEQLSLLKERIAHDVVFDIMQLRLNQMEKGGLFFSMRECMPAIVQALEKYGVASIDNEIEVGKVKPAEGSSHAVFPNPISDFAVPPIIGIPCPHCKKRLFVNVKTSL